jgi:nicotinamidase-related amidase
MSGMESKLHAWHIEEREYARQEQRRGRRHAYTSLDPARTALVVIDMVPFFLEGGFSYGLGVIPNINSIAAAVRTAGGTVAWVVPGTATPAGAGDEFYGAEAAALLRQSGGDGPLTTRVWKDMATDPADLFAEKNAASAFFPGRSSLPSQLDDRGIATVLIAGTLTNVCCESSAVDASTLGYRVIMVADANAARRDCDHNATLYTIYRTFGDVRPTADVLAMIGAGAKAAAVATQEPLLLPST